MQTREFTDQDGRGWTATVAEEAGPDYKGRFYLVMQGRGLGEGAVPVVEVRWNSRRTAQRTLDTMSVVELRRRLRSALGRTSEPALG